MLSIYIIQIEFLFSFRAQLVTEINALKQRLQETGARSENELEQWRKVVEQEKARADQAEKTAQELHKRAQALDKQLQQQMQQIAQLQQQQQVNVRPRFASLFPQPMNQSTEYCIFISATTAAAGNKCG